MYTKLDIYVVILAIVQIYRSYQTGEESADSYNEMIIVKSGIRLETFTIKVGILSWIHVTGVKRIVVRGKCPRTTDVPHLY